MGKQFKSLITGGIYNEDSAPFDKSILYDTTRFTPVEVQDYEAIQANTRANDMFGGAGSTPEKQQEAASWLRQTNPNSYDYLTQQGMPGVMDMETLKGKSPAELTEGEAYRVAYSRYPDLFKQMEALSKRENKPLSSYVGMIPDTATAGYFARAFESRPDYVNPVDPYDADQAPWLKQNAGPIATGVAALTGVGAPLAGALAGFGTASAIGGIKTGIETLPWSLGGAYGADMLASKGVFGGQLQEYQGSRVFGAGGSASEGYKEITGNTPAANQISPSGTQVAGGSTGSVAGTNPFTNSNIHGSVGSAMDKLGTGETAFKNSMSLNGLKINDPELAKLVANSTTGADALNKVISSSPTLLQKISSAFSSGGVISGINEIMQNKTTASLFTGLLSSFLGGSGDKPEKSTVETGGVNVLQSFVDRLNPEYYGLTQDEKDRIFDANIGKIQAALARKGLTKGASEVEATSKLIQAIELEDLQNKQVYANNAWNNFISFLNGNEAVARANYQADLAKYESNKQTLNERIADIVDIISPEKSLSQIMQQYYA